MTGERLSDDGLVIWLEDVLADDARQEIPVKRGFLSQNECVIIVEGLVWHKERYRVRNDPPRVVFYETLPKPCKIVITYKPEVESPVRTMMVPTPDGGEMLVGIKLGPPQLPPDGGYDPNFYKGPLGLPYSPPYPHFTDPSPPNMEPADKCCVGITKLSAPPVDADPAQVVRDLNEKYALDPRKGYTPEEYAAMNKYFSEALDSKEGREKLAQCAADYIKSRMPGGHNYPSPQVTSCPVCLSRDHFGGECLALAEGEDGSVK